MPSHPLLDTLRQQPAQPARHGDWTLEAEQATLGAIGLAAERLRLRRDAPAEQEPRALAEAVARRTTYLLEPLTVVESDPDKALLRSRAPTRTGDDHDYYEGWATPDEFCLERYSGHADQPREPHPVALTWEQAGRLMRDVEAAYAPADEAAP